jgi:hypothetical protein
MKTLVANLLAPSNLAGLGGQPISKAAWAALTAVLLNGIVFVAVVVSYAGVAPLPWVDEVSYADPFLNFASGRGYTSGAWDSQPYGAAWASNSPLYGLLAMPALSLFGPSIEVWRGFWGVVFGASVLLILGSAWALGLIRTGLALLLAGLSLQFPYSMALLTTSGRGVDATCFLVLAALMGVLAFLRGSARVAGVFACGVLVPVAGLQLIPVIACAGLCFAFVDWRKSISEKPSGMRDSLLWEPWHKPLYSTTHSSCSGRTVTISGMPCRTCSTGTPLLWWPALRWFAASS